MMPVMTNGLNELPMVANPHGTAMNNTLQQVSGAIGTAVLLTIMTNRTLSAGADLGKEAVAGNLDMTYPIEHLAMLDGINYTFMISTIIAIVAWILALFIKKSVRHDQMEATKRDAS
jgi:hypothetical protein